MQIGTAVAPVMDVYWLQYGKGRFNMSHITKKVEGAAEELGGKIKQTVGKAIGNEKMEADGRVKKVVGKAKVEAVKAAEFVKDKVDALKSDIREKAHHER